MRKLILVIVLCLVAPTTAQAGNPIADAVRSIMSCIVRPGQCAMTYLPQGFMGGYRDIRYHPPRRGSPKLRKGGVRS
jgi:hypothetical protein